MENDGFIYGNAFLGYKGSGEKERLHNRHKRSTEDAAATVMVVIATIILTGMVMIIFFIFWKMRKQRERTISPVPETPQIQISPPPLEDIPSRPLTSGVPTTLNYTPPPQTLQEICADIESLTRPIVAELKSYTSPPLPVHNTMVAVFMLLGEDRKLLSNWSNILILMKGSRENSLMSRISNFTVADNKVLKEVRKLIKDMTFEDVHSAGKNGSHLFRWVLKVCNDIV
ncbi:uncharacterized protein LOC134816371 [Bolinopsis microptera]|uniref:uncharacterized protein LOC134816371 n=1 Tax=Bolinopsis microptera TaxID=2820187 RepID=UPI003078D9FA